MAKKEKTPSIFGMCLHEQFYIDKSTRVMRVPGGWIYRTEYEPSEGNDTAVFVPFVIDNRLPEFPELEAEHAEHIE